MDHIFFMIAVINVYVTSFLFLISLITIVIAIVIAIFLKLKLLNYLISIPPNFFTCSKLYKIANTFSIYSYLITSGKSTG